MHATRGGYGDGMTSRLSCLVLDAVDRERIAEFWCAVLGWEVTERDEECVRIEGPDGALPIDVCGVPEGKSVKNRLHLDVRADGSTTAEELDRLLALGAVPADVGQGPDVSWVVLADPEGNEFCLLSRTVQEV